jgi:hypothetical protein
MATAQVLKATHIADNRVKGVDDRVAGVDDRVACVDNRVEGVEGRVANVNENVKVVEDKVAVVIDGTQPFSIITKRTRLTLKSLEGRETRVVMDQVKRSSSSISIVNIIMLRAQASSTGSQLRQDLLRWLSPPDPSTNHNIACGAHHKITAEWFFQGSIFTEWKSIGSMLWLHGKRTFFRFF